MIVAFVRFFFFYLGQYVEKRSIRECTESIGQY